jgi:hypothetical protein
MLGRSSKRCIHAYALRADEGLGEDEGEGDSRAYMNLPLVVTQPRAWR